jgi:hypothetical protein
MAGNAGVNRVGLLGGVPLLKTIGAVSAVDTPLAGYGTIGGNDSGPVMTDAIGFGKYTIQLIGPGSTIADIGYSVSIYGTLDPVLFQYIYGDPENGFAQGAPRDPATLAAIVPATEVNPLVTGTNTIGIISGGFSALRAVITTVTGEPDASNNIIVLAMAIP